MQLAKYASMQLLQHRGCDAGAGLQTTPGCFASFLRVARAVVEDASRATMAAMS
jgi:hypothetical protein